MKIGIDLDNVLADFARNWLIYHNKKYHTTLCVEDLVSYNFKEFNEDFNTMISRVKNFYRTNLFKELKPISGSKKAIKSLKNNHSLTIITSRPNWTEENTRKWLNTHFKESFHEILLSNQFGNVDGKNLTTKIEICKIKGIEVMIEDAPEYSYEVAEGGIEVLLLDMPWNRNINLLKNIIRVDSWQDIVDYVKLKELKNEKY